VAAVGKLVDTTMDGQRDYLLPYSISEGSTGSHHISPNGFCLTKPCKKCACLFKPCTSDKASIFEEYGM
jgi:hypothetical protein